MKRIDLHIHTVATPWDEDFSFDLEQLRKHIEDWEIDAIAITNHNTFDYQQYKDIAKQIGSMCVVYPGVEVSALGTHLLVICDGEKAQQLEGACNKLHAFLGYSSGGRAFTSNSCTLEELQEAFPLLGDCIVIPHYEKAPAISEENLRLISNYVCACETSSLKKALRYNKLPDQRWSFVYFTDYRFGSESIDGQRPAYRPGGVYVRTDSTSFGAIHRALRGREVSLAQDGSQSLELYPGVTSTEGVNLILGRRSTGKTFTLERVRSLCDDDDVYYIKQGDLVDASKEADFYSSLNRQFESVRAKYYEPLEVLSEEMERCGADGERSADVSRYLKQLKSYAETKVQNDTFSNSALFKRRPIPDVNCAEGWNVIKAVCTILDSDDYAEDLEETVGRSRLLEFLKRVSSDVRGREIDEQAVKAANKATNAVKARLSQSSVDPYPEPELVDVFRKEAFADAFSSLVSTCWKERVVANDNYSHFQKYTLVAERKKFSNANDIKKAMHIPQGVILNNITRKPSRDYINRLLELDGRPAITRGLFSLTVEVRDERGSLLSGGQRTECVFLGRLTEAIGKPVVLIDEPESSFDNLFLDGPIANQIRKLGKRSIVFVTTHNQVLGFGLKPNKVFITSYDDKSKAYQIHCGDLEDEDLCGKEVPSIPTKSTVMEILEAGKKSYESRQSYYEGGD